MTAKALSSRDDHHTLSPGATVVTADDDDRVGVTGLEWVPLVVG